MTGPNQGYVQGGVTPRAAMESWFRTTNPNYGIILRWRNYGYGFYAYQDGVLLNGYTNFNGGGANGGHGGSDGTWHHAFGQWTGTVWQVFLDGVQVGEAAGTGDLSYAGANAVAIGRDADACDGNVPSFKGDLAHTAFYNHPLTPERVKAHFCAGMPTAAGCGPTLVANAGPDQTVPESSTITLDAGASRTTTRNSLDVGPVTIDGRSSIFSAGHAIAISPSGDMGAGPLLAVNSGLAVHGNDAITFSDAAGITTAYGGCGGPQSPPDGVSYENTDISSFGGISGIIDGSRQQMLVGVFLTDAEPADPAPARLDFTNNHDFLDLSPALQQTFFIGDGHTAGGGVQTFHPPAGATRLFLGLADGWGFHGAPGAYGDNCYAYTTKLHQQTGVSPLTYQWQLVGSQGPPVQLSSTTDAKPSFAAFDDGTYTFRLIVSDGANTATDEITVRVMNERPVISRVEADPAATDGLAQATVTFTDRGPFDTHTATFDWGDGSPVDAVNAAVDGSGWGYGSAGHVYASTGDKAVRVKVTDNNGGVSAEVVKAFNVGAAGQGESVPGAGLWAQSSTSTGAVTITGSANSVSGLVHSNNDIVLGGSGNQLVGGTDYRTTITLGTGNTVAPAAAQLPAASALPYQYPIVDYQPGGRAAKAAGSRYVAVSASECTAGKWKPRKPLTSGLFYVPCAVAVSGADVAGQVTIAATGDIQLSGAKTSLTPFIDGLLFVTTSAGTRAIDVAGSGHTLGGAMFAGSGGIELTGAKNTLECGIVHQTVRISGSQNKVAGVNCGSGVTAGQPVAIAAPPVVVPDLTAELSTDKAVVRPGDSVDYTATARNGRTGTGRGATVFMPVEIGVDNRGGSMVTVSGVTYTFEIHDPVTGLWTTLAATGPDATADQRIAALTGRANPMTGVVYPTAGANAFAGTRVAPARLASWAGLAQVSLTSDQVARLRDPARVDAVRNTVTIATDGYFVRKITRFAADPLASLRAAPGADIANVQLHLQRAGAAPQTFDALTNAALANLTPGQTAAGTATTTVTVPAARSTSESDDAYLARLRKLDGTKLYASAYAIGTAGVGPVFATQQLTSATERLPIVSARITAPAVIDAGTNATYTVTVTNTGSETATGLDLKVTVPGVGDLTLTGVPGSLAPGQTAAVTASTTTDADATTTRTATAALRWTHTGGAAGLYGPVGGAATVTARPAVALKVTKFASTGTNTPAGQFQYNVEVRNDGNNALTGVVFDDPIDANLTVAPGTLTTSGGTIVSGTLASDRNVRIELGTLAVNGSVTLSFLADSTRAVPGTTTVTNQAVVTSDQLAPVPSDDPALRATYHYSVLVTTAPGPVASADQTVVAQ